MSGSRCRICGSVSAFVFRKTLLGKYDVAYYECGQCGFVQTDEPFWLPEAYANVITSLDIGLLDRNIGLRDEVSELIDTLFPQATRFLDYAGGYGVFVRLMRDAGFDFHRQDLYCDNLFARHFDVTDLPAGSRFDLLTAFEVAEHLANPIEGFATMFGYSENVVFSTQLVPGRAADAADWWYIANETGQHVAFYTPAALRYLAGHFSKRYYHNGRTLHLFTSQTFEKKRADYVFRGMRPLGSRMFRRKLPFRIPRQSLLPADFAYIRNVLRRGADH